MTTALRMGVKIPWLEARTGVRYETLRRHYRKWVPTEGEEELFRLAVEAPDLLGEGGKLSPVSRNARDNFQKRLINRGAFECEEGDLNPRFKQKKPTK